MTEAVFDFPDIRSRIKGDPMIKKKEPEISPIGYNCVTCQDRGYVPSPIRTGRWRTCYACLNPKDLAPPSFPS